MKILFKIEHWNFGEMFVGVSWEYTKWDIYDDLTMNVETKVGNNINNYTKKISQEMLDEIIKNATIAHDIDTIVDGCDGTAWKFEQYNNDQIIWDRNLSYIFGIKPLEKIAQLLVDEEKE